MFEKQLDKLEFDGQCPLTMRAWCGAFRNCPNPLGIVTAQQLDKLEFDEDMILMKLENAELNQIEKIVAISKRAFETDTEVSGR